MHADFQYEYCNDSSFFREKSTRALNEWRGFGRAVYNDPLGAVAPGIMEAWRDPTNPEAWGKAAVDIALIGFSAAKIGQAATGLCRAGRIGEEFAIFGKVGNIANETFHVGTFFGNESAQLSTNGLKLAKQLASEAQMAEKGLMIIEPSSLKEAGRLSQQYGGCPSDWIKKSSSSFSKGRTQFETHWYENKLTGYRVEFKTKLKNK